PAGRYLITGTIEIPSNTTVEGQGDITEITLGDGYSLTARQFRGDTMSYPYLVTDVGSRNVHFRNFKVTGNRNFFEDALHHAVALMDTSFSTIEDVSTEYINYDMSTARTAYLMAFNI